MPPPFLVATNPDDTQDAASLELIGVCIFGDKCVGASAEKAENEGNLGKLHFSSSSFSSFAFDQRKESFVYE